MFAKIYRHLIIITVVALCCNGAFAATQPPKKKSIQVKYSIPATGNYVPSLKKFEKKFVKLLKRWRIPGASITIMKDNKILLSRAYGWADLDHKVNVRPDSLFRIASVSKLITAVTILKLVEENKLSLNSKAFRILSNIKPLPKRHVNKRIYQISVKNLLQMASGWHTTARRGYDPIFGPWPKRITTLLDGTPATCKKTVRLMMSQRLNSSPGSTFVYSNLDYCILGLIINKVTHNPYGAKSYAAYVNKHILYPIGVHDMYIGSTIKDQTKPGEVHYHRYKHKANAVKPKPSTYFPYSDTQILRKNYAAAGWVASSIDLAKFMQALMHGKIISKKMVAIMTAPPNHVSKKAGKYFAMGCGVYNGKNGKTIIRTGSFTGTNAMVINKPDGTSIAVIFNTRPSTYHLFREFRPQLKKLLLAKL